MVKTTTAKNSADVIKWIVANDHHEGYWLGAPNNPHTFVLQGDHAKLRIPASVHIPGIMQSSDFEISGRMYEPSKEGLALVSKKAKLRPIIKIRGDEIGF